MDDPVIAQLAAYNDHDVEAFVACYTSHATLVDGSGRTLLTGHEEIRERYTQLFVRHDDVHADIEARIREGEWVVDHERVRAGGEVRGYVVAYRVRDGLVDRAIILGE